MRKYNKLAFAYCWRGMSYAVKDDYDRAISDIESYLRLNPHDQRARDSLNRLKHKRGWSNFN